MEVAVSMVLAGGLPAYSMGRLWRRVVFAPSKRGGRPFLRMEPGPIAAVIPGSRRWLATLVFWFLLFCWLLLRLL